MGLIPKAGSTNEKGEFLDVLKNIRAKKEISAELLPILWEMVTEMEKLGHIESDNEELVEAKRVLKKSAKTLGISLNPNLPE